MTMNKRQYYPTKERRDDTTISISCDPQLRRDIDELVIASIFKSRSAFIVEACLIHIEKVRKEIEYIERARREYKEK